MAAPIHAPLRKVTLNAARSKEFPEGSIRHGYDFVAPLTGDGRIDLGAWKRHRGECFAHRFWGAEPALRGLLVHHAGGRWRLDLGFRVEREQERTSRRRKVSASEIIRSRSASTSRCARRRASFRPSGW